MSSPFFPLILADAFDRFRLQLPDPIVNWLTPVWILCLGAAAGLILCAAIWGILRLLSSIPRVDSLSERPAARWIAIGILTAVFMVCLIVANRAVGGRALADGLGMQGPRVGEVLDPRPLESVWTIAGC